MDSVVLLDGGHRVHLAGITPQEVEVTVDKVLDENRSFVYFQPTNYPDNGVVFQSASIVGVIAKIPRAE